MLMENIQKCIFFLIFHLAHFFCSRVYVPSPVVKTLDCESADNWRSLVPVSIVTYCYICLVDLHVKCLRLESILMLLYGLDAVLIIINVDKRKESCDRP